MPSMAQLGVASQPTTPARTDSPLAENASVAGTADTAMLAAPELAPPTLSAQASASAPPSRPGTALNNASSIDDLLGAPGARKGGTLKRQKKGRGYVDVMAK